MSLMVWETFLMVQHSSLPFEPDDARETADALPDLTPPPRVKNDFADVRRKKTIDGIRKHISLVVSQEEKLLLRDHAIERGIPLNQLLLEWIGPHLEKLKR